MTDLTQYLPSPGTLGVSVTAAAIVILIGFFFFPDRTARAFALFFLLIRSGVRLYRYLRGRPDPAPRATEEADTPGVKAPTKAQLKTLSAFLPDTRPPAHLGEERED